MKNIITHLIAICFTCSSDGQNLFFQSYTTSQGLSQNSVYSIAETSEGFMWFGTQDGINRFDGKNFLHIIPKKSNRPRGQYEINDFSKQVNTLTADSNWLWAGTTYELIIYDRVYNVFIDPQKACKGFNLKSGSWIIKTMLDKHKKLWILTRDKGLNCYNRTAGQMEKLNWGGPSPTDLISMDIDKAGTIWVCTESELFSSRDGSSFTPVHLQKLIKKQDIKINCIAVVNNELWLSANSPVIPILHLEGGSVDTVSWFNKEYRGLRFLPDARIIFQSDAKTAWIGSRSQGLIKINLADKSFENAEAINENNTLQRQFILSLFTNSQGITWIGLSGGGIAKFDEAKFKFGRWKPPAYPGGTITDMMILSIFSRNNSDFYMGTLSGGLLHLNTTSHNWSYYLPKELSKNPESKNIYAITDDNNGALWMATWAGLYSFDIGKKKFVLYTDARDKQSKQLCAILKLTESNKLITAGYNGGISIFNLSEKKFEQPRDPQHTLDTVKLRVRHMQEGKDGDVYMGTEARGFVKYNYLSGQFTFFPHIEAYAGDCRYFLFEGPNLWLATTDGLLQLNKNDFTIIKRWTMLNGLPNDYVYAIEKDNNGQLWGSTNLGLFSLNTTTGICQSFTEEDGLNGLEFNTACIYKTGNGSIWFGGTNGLNNTSPAPVAINTHSPAPLVTAIKVMNQPLQSATTTSYVKSLVLPHTKNFISFEFHAPVFSQSENIIYEYKLTGVDTGWVSNGRSSNANYTQLKPGHYTFMVRSANANNIWSSVNSLSITIVPPWHARLWFKLLLIILSVSLLTFFVKRRINAIHYKAATQQRITETEMAALKAQMNPHFMFNCINSIDAFIHNNDKYNATLYLNKFARLLRNILDSSKQNTVPFSKDIETLKLYIEMEELRHENKFKTTFSISEELINGDYKVPPLIIQPFVENAILHGLKNRDDNNGLLQVEIKKTGEKIHYTITDNGIGREAARQIMQNKESHYGMQMSYDRIKLFNKEQQPSVTVTDLKENVSASGTKIEVLLKMM